MNAAVLVYYGLIPYAKLSSASSSETDEAVRSATLFKLSQAVPWLATRLPTEQDRSRATWAKVAHVVQALGGEESAHHALRADADVFRAWKASEAQGTALARETYKAWCAETLDAAG